MTSVNGQEVIPSPKRLMRSLRDLGYDFSTAVADIIDNSIEAGSTCILIDIEFNGENSWVRIADNGFGMNLMQLQEAMRYGSERDYDNEKDLGKFGLGLKTASMSQCQRLVVASRSNVELKEINAYSWDMEHVDKTNRWEIIKVSKRELKPILNSILDNSTGTVVFWQKLDRILGYKHPYGEFAKRRLLTMCRDLEEHLAMVFHRFLAGDVPGKRLKIFLNGNLIKPWDPFARKEPKTQELKPIPILLNYDGKAGVVTLEPYVLPHQDDFSSKEIFNKTSGPKRWNRQQGFYIYRANRLIQSGGWCGLKTMDEHLKLARIALSFYPHLDDAFKINVVKMNVQLPIQIRERIENEIRPVTKLAQEAYRKNSQKQKLPLINNPIHERVNVPFHPNTIETEPQTSQQITINTAETVETEYSVNTPITKYWTVDEIFTKLESLAKDEEKPVLIRLFDLLDKDLNAHEEGHK